MEELQGYDASSTSSTNWSIAGGSLASSVTFESSFALITGSDENEDDVHDPIADDSTSESPLLLCPTSPDSTTPCEITIAFAQKHEVRQVYLRSTARVYEIYYATKHQGSNEYLCTVRCGVASRDEEVLHAANLDEAALAHIKGAGKELDEKRLKHDSNSNSNEDDWVEVKAPDTPLLDSGSSVPSNFSVNSGITQDLYEATAEINDANPCMSITLRLLSLQNKGCVCVDELYVFADPVESTSENEVGQMGNAGGSSLMAMLAPTLLQLSKTAGLRRIQNEDSFGIKENLPRIQNEDSFGTKENLCCIQNEDSFGTNEKGKTQENGSKSIGPLNCANEILQEGKPSIANRRESITATIEPNQHEIPPQHKDREAKGNSSFDHIERFLDQLVFRVCRVEDLLLKFEDNMLKPMNSIDARLQRVEQQLEELSKKPKNSELPSCTRYSAPEFSCHDSENYTPFNIGNESSCDDLCESREKELSSSLQCDEIIFPVNATQSFPSLVVTAPEFSNADDEEDDHASKIDSPKEKPKQTMSIDDALASALAGFLSSTSSEPQKYTQALAVITPDFPNEDGSNDKKVSPKSHLGVTSESCSLDTSDGMDSTTASVSSNCPLERIAKETCSLNDNDYEQTAKEVVEDCEGLVTYDGIVDCIVTPARHDLPQIAGDVGNGDISRGTSKTLVLDEADILNQFLENHIDDDSGADEEGVPRNTEIEAEVTKQGPREEFLQSVLELSYASSVVDFESPILDVKFASQDNSNNESSLEALLSDISDMPVTDGGASCSEKSDDGSQAGEDCNLISVGDGEPAWPVTDGHFSVALDGDDGLSRMPLNLDIEYLEDYQACCNQELSAASLI